MDDNDIIKGLENWALKDLIVIWCNGKDNNLMPVTVKDILKVINNLKAENERLKAVNDSFTDIGKLYSEIKAEAVKEFAERLKKCSQWLPLIAMPDPFVTVSDIDNLVKEMEVKQCTDQKKK